MFNFVQNISSALKSYETKAADANMKQKRGTADYVTGASDHSEHEDSTPALYGDDESIVSVKALILFLEDYIEARLSSKLNQIEPQKQDDNFAPWLRTEHSNANMPQTADSKNAANAYASSSSLSKTGQERAKHKLAHGELKEVYGLVQDLRQIQKSDVFYIRIDDDKSFLDSIFEAVKKRKID